jgi:hypothetical protein
MILSASDKEPDDGKRLVFLRVRIPRFHFRDLVVVGGDSSLLARMAEIRAGTRPAPYGEPEAS